MTWVGNSAIAEARRAEIRKEISSSLANLLKAARDGGWNQAHIECDNIIELFRKLDSVEQQIMRFEKCTG